MLGTANGCPSGHITWIKTSAVDQVLNWSVSKLSCIIIHKINPTWNHSATPNDQVFIILFRCGFLFVILVLPVELFQSYWTNSDIYETIKTHLYQLVKLVTQLQSFTFKMHMNYVLSLFLQNGIHKKMKFSRHLLVLCMRNLASSTSWESVRNSDVG